MMSRCLAELWPTKFVDVAGRRLVCHSEICNQLIDLLCRLFSWLNLCKIVNFSSLAFYCFFFFFFYSPVLNDN